MLDPLQQHRERQAREMLKRRERELRREYWERKAWKYAEPEQETA